MLIWFDETELIVGIVLLIALLPILWWKKHSLPYILFFSIFWIYILVVVQSVIFPIWINIDSSSPIFNPSINIIPLYFGDCSVPEKCYSSIIDNIILTIPFGFGINFIVGVKPRYITWLAIALGLIFESSQLIPILILGGGFHVVDINDVIFNATGVLIGYGLFRLFAWAFITIKNNFDVAPKWIFEDIYNIVLQQIYTDK